MGFYHRKTNQRYRLEEIFSANTINKVNVKSRNYLICKSKSKLYNCKNDAAELVLELILNMFPNKENVLEQKKMKLKIANILLEVISKDPYIKSVVLDKAKLIGKFDEFESSHITMKIFKTLYTRRKFQEYYMFSVTDP